MKAYHVLDKYGNHLLHVELDDAGQWLSLSAEGPESKPLKIRLDQIKTIILNPPVSSSYSQGHFLCCLEDHAGNNHYLRADSADELSVASYGSLMIALHEILKRQAIRPQFMTGLKSRSGFWLLAAGMSISVGALAVASVFGMIRKQNYLSGVGINLLLFAATFLVLRFAARTLLPKPYDPHHPPSGLIPNR